jgi:hypothetical protein
MRLRAWMLVATLSIAGSVGAQTPPPSDGRPGPSPEMQAARAALMKACEVDVKNYCPDKQGREVIRCLRGDSDKLSAGCADAMSKLPRPNRPPQ